MNWQKKNKNIQNLIKKLFSLLPKNSFVLDINPTTDRLNFLFISTITLSKFIIILKDFFGKRNVKYIISEDAVILKDGAEIAYLNYATYMKRLSREELFLHQSRATSWSIGPWLVEGFWSNILSSELVAGKYNLRKDKNLIKKNCLTILGEFLNKEIQNKTQFLLDYPLTNLEREIVNLELNIAKIRKFFIEREIFLKGIKDVKVKKDQLSKNDLSMLEDLIKD